MKTITSFLLVFFFFVSFAFSQLVTPSHRVHTRLNVRDLPSSAGQIIGSLEPGETVPLLSENVPYWYMILFQSDTAYVHKSWSEIINLEDDQVDLVIGSWNIKWYGHYNDDRRNYESMVDIIKEFDVMAVQELRGDEYLLRLETLKNELNSHGYSYDYIVSDSTGYLGNPRSGFEDYIEHFAYFWNTETLMLMNPSQPWEFIDLPAINNPTFRQVPMVADFKVTGGDGFDFKLVTVHTVFQKNIQEVREAELNFLHNWMNGTLRDTATVEKDIFIIGDFNANPDQSGQNHYFKEIITDTAMYRVVFEEPKKAGEDTKRTTILVKSNIEPDDYLLPAYDHLLLSKHTTYAISIYPITWSSGVIGVVEFDQDPKYEGWGRDSVSRDMSDHRPIWIKLDYNTEDRD